MSNYKIKMKKSKLYHSDTYLGEDFSEGLKHYKYLRKYQKNGHTYYVYDDHHVKARDKLTRVAADHLANNWVVGKDGTMTQYHYAKDGTYNSKTTLRGEGSKEDKERYNKYKLQSAILKKEKKFIDKHYKQKIKDIPKKYFSKAVSAVSNLLRKIRGD